METKEWGICRVCIQESWVESWLHLHREKKIQGFFLGLGGAIEAAKQGIFNLAASYL